MKEHCLETKETEYAYQKGKQVILASLQGQNKILWNVPEEDKPAMKEPF